MQTPTFHIEPKIGTGIYSVKDISIILNLPQKKVGRVLNEIWNKRFLPDGQEYSSGEGREKVVNFYALIEFYTFYQLKDKGVGTKRIIKSHTALSQVFNSPYPFAQSNLLTDGKEILFKKDSNLISADQHLQIKIKEVVQCFFDNIEFDENLLAEKFYPKGKNNSVVVDPHHRLGEPIVENTNISAESIFSFYNAGESIPDIASLYDLSEKQVKDAVDFFLVAA